MINLLFLLATAQASDVYDVCRIERQRWSEREQKFKAERVQTFISFEMMQIIVHNRTIEVDRDHRKIESKFTQSGNQCWREHDNSFLCYDESEKMLFWEWNKRNGDTLMDVMTICRINGEPAR